MTDPVIRPAAEARRIYAKAPLVQATVSINVPPPSGFDAQQFNSFRDTFVQDYPLIAPIMRGQLQIRLDASGSNAASNQEVIGLAFSREGQQQAFRYLANECTFTRNTPYGQWESFSKEFEPVWLNFAAITNSRRCERIGLRYVNRFDFTSEKVAVFDYFRVFPAISADLPQTMDGFFLQAQLNDGDYALIVNQGNAQPPSDNIPTSIVLDFDIFAQGIEFEDPGEVLVTLNEMHQRLNHAFEASITDRTREMIS